MARDDFLNATKEKLALRVGFLCSNPLCGCATVGPERDGEDIISIGVAAHICAASPRGPRYDKGMTKDERRSFSNGIWLCQSCARLIDVEEDKYTVNLLKTWKEVAEQKQRLKMRVAGANNGTERMIYIFTIQHSKLFEKNDFRKLQAELITRGHLFNIKKISLVGKHIQIVSGFETNLEKECYMSFLFSFFRTFGLPDITIAEESYC